MTFLLGGNSRKLDAWRGLLSWLVHPARWQQQQVGITNCHNTASASAPNSKSQRPFSATEESVEDTQQPRRLGFACLL